MAFSVEELEAKRHDRTDFDCGEELLNQYLRTLAGQHRAKGIATTSCWSTPAGRPEFSDITA